MQPVSFGGERVVEVIGNLTHVSGFLGMKQKRYSLVITDRRLIFAEMSKEKLKDVMDQARTDAELAGKGRLGKWSAQAGAFSRHHEIYRQMTPEAALAETPGNFAIERDSIEKVKFKTGSVDEQHVSFDRVVIKAASGKYTLNVGGSLAAVKDAFRTAGIA